jgi:hypothetical protein
MRDMAHGWLLTRLLSAVAFGTRTPTVRVARRRAILTVAVEQLEVVCPISPTATSGADVIDFHPIARRKGNRTPGANTTEPRAEEKSAARAKELGFCRLLPCRPPSSSQTRCGVVGVR